MSYTVVQWYRKSKLPFFVRDASNGDCLVWPMDYIFILSNFSVRCIPKMSSKVYTQRGNWTELIWFSF